LNNLTKTVAHLRQVNTLMERPQTLPANLETVLTQLQFLPRWWPGQCSTSQTSPLCSNRTSVVELRWTVIVANTNDSMDPQVKTDDRAENESDHQW